MTLNIHSIIADLLSQPVAMLPYRANMLANLDPEQSVLTSNDDKFHALPAASYYTTEKKQSIPRTYAVYNGVAIIPVVGDLITRGEWYYTRYGFTSYQGLAYQLKQARDDKDVKRIVLDINSYGGAVNGMITISNLVHEVGKNKKIIAVIDDIATSAAYAIASQADQILISETSKIANIGTYMAHTDRSKAMESAGLSVTEITSGEHKADGSPYKPLGEDVRNEWQNDINHLNSLFFAAVMKGRLVLTKKAITEMQARPYTGQKAIDLKLADGFGTVETAVNMLFDKPVVNSNPDDSKIETGGEKAKMTKDAGAGAVSQEAIGAAAVHQRENGAAAGAKAMQERIKAIMESPEAKGREKLAAHYAYNTSSNAEEAIAAMAEAPKAEADKSGKDNENILNASQLAAEGAVAVVTEDGGVEIDEATARSNRMKAAGKMASSFKR